MAVVTPDYTLDVNVDLPINLVLNFRVPKLLDSY